MTEWYGVFAPPKTPAAIVDRAAQAVAKVTAMKEIGEAFAKVGVVPRSNSPAALAALIRSEAETWGPIIRSTGFKPIE